MRLAFLDMVADWMLRLRERIDHHARLMPYALSALSDPSPSVQLAALKILDDLGAQWEEEHKADLKVGRFASPHLRVLRRMRAPVRLHQTCVTSWASRCRPKVCSLVKEQ